MCTFPATQHYHTVVSSQYYTILLANKNTHIHQQDSYKFKPESLKAASAMS